MIKYLLLFVFLLRANAQIAPNVQAAPSDVSGRAVTPKQEPTTTAKEIVKGTASNIAEGHASKFHNLRSSDIFETSPFFRSLFPPQPKLIKQVRRDITISEVSSYFADPENSDSGFKVKRYFQNPLLSGLDSKPNMVQHIGFMIPLGKNEKTGSNGPVTPAVDDASNKLTTLPNLLNKLFNGIMNKTAKSNVPAKDTLEIEATAEGSESDNSTEETQTTDDGIIAEKVGRASPSDSNKTELENERKIIEDVMKNNLGEVGKPINVNATDTPTMPALHDTEEFSDLQKQLLDVNIDGKLDETEGVDMSKMKDPQCSEELFRILSKGKQQIDLKWLNSLPSLNTPRKEGADLIITDIISAIGQLDKDQTQFVDKNAYDMGFKKGCAEIIPALRKYKALRVL